MNQDTNAIEAYGESLLNLGQVVLVAFEGDHEAATKFVDTVTTKVQTSPGFLKWLADPNNQTMINTVIGGKSNILSSLFKGL
jgi:hypothetical protein